MKTSRPLFSSYLLIASILFVGLVSVSDAGTRFSNRKSKVYGHARSHGLDTGSPNHEAKPARPSRTDTVGNTYARTPVSASAPVREKKPGLLARIFGKKSESRAGSRQNRPARQAAPAPVVSPVKINHSLLASARTSSTSG